MQNFYERINAVPEREIWKSKRSSDLEELLQEARRRLEIHKRLELSQKLEASISKNVVNKDIEISNLEMFKKQSQAPKTKCGCQKINDLQNRLKDSMTEIEDLHNQVSDLKHNLIEKEAMVLNHSRSSSRDGPKVQL
ncbi:unnamed protein product [Rhizophagus irregularis]|nr:unnamed protein product [Rhizophagus irregularis]